MKNWTNDQNDIIWIISLYILVWMTISHHQVFLFFICAIHFIFSHFLFFSNNDGINTSKKHWYISKFISLFSFFVMFSSHISYSYILDVFFISFFDIPCMFNYFILFFPHILAFKKGETSKTNKRRICGEIYIIY